MGFAPRLAVVTDCVLLEDIWEREELSEQPHKLRESQGFIVGAPVYFGTARGDALPKAYKAPVTAGCPVSCEQLMSE